MPASLGTLLAIFYTLDFQEQQELRAAGFIAFLLAFPVPSAQAGETVKVPVLEQVQVDLDRNNAAHPDAAAAPKTADKPEKTKQDNKKAGLFVDEPEPACGEE